MRKASNLARGERDSWYELVVIVPAFNEATSIVVLLERVIAVRGRKQVIVVDDGSGDGTADVVAAWMDARAATDIALVRHLANRGKGAAIRTGLALARGEIVLVQDADLEYDPAEYPALIGPIERGEAEVVYGSRFLRGDNRTGSLMNRLCVWLLNWAVFLLFGRRITDEATCYKVFRTELLRRLDLKCERFEFCPEVTAKLCRLGIAIHEAPISYRARSTAEGKKIGWRDAVRAFWTLAWWRFAPMPKESMARGEPERDRAPGRSAAGSADACVTDGADEVCALRGKARLTAVPNGFTLIELLTVISIIGMLMSLLLPAVQQARESGRRATCANHLKQVAIAFGGLESAHGVLPSNGGWDGKQKVKSITGALFTPATTNLGTGITTNWGVGDPRCGPHTQTGSWGVSILPYLERRDIFTAQGWSLPVSMYVCPSRRRAETFAVIAQDAYAKYEGGGWKWAKTDYAANAMIVEARPRCWSLAGIKDGTSQTILVGEKAFDASLEGDSTWYWDEPFFLGGSGGTGRLGTRILPDGAGHVFAGHWGSPHPDGALFAFVDGSVRFLLDEIPQPRLRAYLTPTGQEGLGDR